MPTMPHMHAFLACKQRLIAQTTAKRLPWLRASPVPAVERSAVGTLSRRRQTIQTLLPLLSRLTAPPFFAPPHHGPKLCGPARPLLLRGTLERQGVGLHIGGDDAAGADVGPIADLHGRHKRSIGAHKGTPANIGKVRVEAIVVAEYRAGTDVGAFAHPSIADVGKMVGLGTRLHSGVLDLHKVADACPGGDVSAGAQAGKGTNACTLAD